MPHEMSNLLAHARTNQENNPATSSGLVAAKFCSFGIVVSVKWFSCYVTVAEGQLRLYDDEQSARQSPESYVLKIYLSRNHQASEVKMKSYSQNGQGTIDLWCFYVQIDNGMFLPTKELKIGCVNQGQAESLARAVNSNSRG